MRKVTFAQWKMRMTLMLQIYLPQLEVEDLPKHGDVHISNVSIPKNITAEVEIKICKKLNWNTAAP